VSCVASSPITIRSGDDERGNGRQAAGEEADDVERRLVRPVHVLEDEDRRLDLELAQESGRNLMRACRARNERLQLVAGLLTDVEQRAEGMGREERVARARENSERGRLVAAEPADELRLADAGLSSQEDETAFAMRSPGECVRE
jgi:hypothetical protein